MPRATIADNRIAPPEESASASPAPMTTAEVVVGALIAHGIDTLYALPGVHNDHFFDALFKASDHIRTLHTRHEQGAAYMALGAALATGKPQAYAVVPGPGLLNTGAALLTAYGMNAQVLALIGQIPDAAIGRGLGHLHEIRDQAGILSMGNKGQPNSGGSQFFVTLQEMRDLNKVNSAFGRVIRGMDVVRKIGATRTRNERPVTPVILQNVRIEVVP